MSQFVASKIIGVETRGLPWQEHEETVTLTAVLVLGPGYDLVCYVGVGSPEWVADRGDKVSLKEATLYFPTVEAHMEERVLKYRGPVGDPFPRPRPEAAPSAGGTADDRE